MFYVFRSSSTISFFTLLLDGILLGLFMGRLSTRSLADDPGAVGLSSVCTWEVTIPVP